MASRGQVWCPRTPPKNATAVRYLIIRAACTTYFMPLRATRCWLRGRVAIASRVNPPMHCPTMRTNSQMLLALSRLAKPRTVPWYRRWVVLVSMTTFTWWMHSVSPVHKAPSILQRKATDKQAKFRSVACGPPGACCCLAMTREPGRRNKRTWSGPRQNA